VTIPPPIAPTIITPTINNISSLTIDIKWSYVDNADRYQLQICKGNNYIIDTVVSTTSYNFVGEDNSNYTFRVRAGNPVGWGPWSEWRQFKILLPPNTPTLVSPFNGAVLQNNNIVVLNWNSIPTAASYLVEISNANTGAVQTFEVLAPYTVLNFPGYWGNTYLWKIKAKNPSGESGWSNSWMFTIQENIPPKLEINSYPQYTNQSNVTISGKVYDLESGVRALYCGLNLIPVNSDGTFEISFNLNEGINSFTFVVGDKAGNKSQKTVNIIKDTIPPEINITFPVAPIYPSYEGITVISNIKVTGTVKDFLPITLMINNENIPVDSFGNFVYQTNLNYGLNKIYLKAIDAAGNVSEKTLIIYKTINPKFIFKINNPKIQIQVINKQGQLDWVQEEIDPGRYTIPVIVKGRVFIPVRKFIELINGSVDWDAETQKITIKVPARGKTIELWIGKPLARVVDSYGKEQWIQIEKGDNTITPFIKNNRSYFPLRFIVEQLNAVVEWDQVLQQVKIEFPIVP
ncbi:MAG: stalk domain-containing protein, partial [Minisyncoccia bacterium]